MPPAGEKLRLRVLVPALVVAVIAILAVLYVANVFTPPKHSSKSTPLAPNFTLADIYGQPFTLSHYRNNSVVVVEFTSLSCSECQITEQTLHSLYSAYNQSGRTNVQIVSVYVEPSYGDSVSALRAYHDQNGITWWMARDSANLATMTAYGVGELPTVVIIDKTGHATYDLAGHQDQSVVQAKIAAALAGTSPAILIVTVGVFALAGVAGLATFFSPCAFPMFPGYMSLFLGLNTTSAETQSASGGTYKGALRRAFSAGSIAALGMLVVFSIIGVVLIFAASVVRTYIPYFLIVVGVALVVLGGLLLTNLQYWKIVRPLQDLWQRLRGNRPTDASVTPSTAGSKGLYLKLFSYGMGYAAAAAGCVAPVIFATIIAATALGLVSGILSILIFSLTAASLMIGVTVLIAVAGKRYVNLLKAYTPVIKKVSAGVLVIVGVYLLYYFYTAWVV
jgi:cytochrome c-type biogenesis protein